MPVDCWRVNFGRFKRDWAVLNLIAIWNRQPVGFETNANINKEDDLDHQVKTDVEQTENKLAVN